MKSIDEIKLECGRCGESFTVRDGRKMEGDPNCLDEQGKVKPGTWFTCPHCGQRHINPPEVK